MSATPHVRAVSDREGRILVIMTHNTDFGDAFEREGDSREYFETLCRRRLRLRRQRAAVLAHALERAQAVGKNRRDRRDR